MLDKTIFSNSNFVFSVTHRIFSKYIVGPHTFEYYSEICMICVGFKRGILCLFISHRLQYSQRCTIAAEILCRFYFNHHKLYGNFWINIPLIHICIWKKISTNLHKIISSSSSSYALCIKINDGVWCYGNRSCQPI